MKKTEKKERFSIGGMTCVNCQNRIEKKLKDTVGIIDVFVDYNSGTADIIYDEGRITRNKIIAVIENLGYKVLKNQGQQKTDVKRTVCMLVIIILLFAMLQQTGILNRLVPSQLADTKMGYGLLFVIGLLTSVHCIAMCGGINLSQCIPGTVHSASEKKGKAAIFFPALAYNLGRVFSYTVIGFVFGMIGFLIGGDTEFALSTLLQGIMKMAAGLLMVIMGINMLGLFPWLRKFTLRIPGFIARKVGKKKAENSRPFLVGILNGFMPCGPLQTMWIVALATGNPFAGALAMFMFSLRTVPLMLGLGSIVAALGKKFTDKVMTAGAVLVVVLGLALFSQGGSLSGLLPSSLLPIQDDIDNSVKSDAETTVVDGVQVVNSTLSPGRYPNITVQVGIPVKWTIDAPEGSINGCNYKMLIQDYDIEYTFQTGENVIEFTPTETGTVQYSCWMGMIYGNIFVTDGEEEVATSDSEVDAPVPSGICTGSCCAEK